MRECPKLREHVATSHHDRGMIILDASTAMLFRSNNVGACVLRAIRDRVPVSIIVQRVSATYGIPADVAEADINTFVGELQRQKLLEQ